MPRSRSSILLETISLHNNIKILGEDINSITDRFNTTYFSKLKPLLDHYSNFNNGVIRFHPLQLCCMTQYRSLRSTSEQFTLADFDWFKFKQYDKIYFTVRNSVSDNIASNTVAERLNKFTYKSKDEIVKNVDPIVFSVKDHFNIRNYIDSMTIISRLKEYFLKNNIIYTELEYDIIPQYIKDNFPKSKSFHVSTDYNYKNIISNYDDIKRLYEYAIQG